MNPFIAVAACAFFVVASVTDLRFRKISNRLNVAALLVALVMQLALDGVHGLAQAGIGFATGLVVMFLPFAAGLIGGGDVKFAAAAGAFLGWRIVLVGLAGGVILGGVVAVVSLVARGRFGSAMTSLRKDLFTMALGMRPTTLKKTAAVQTVPYGVLLAIGLAGALAADTWRLVP